MLNDSASVSPALTKRVRKIARDLGYQPFGPARALRQQLTAVWAAIVADIENPFFTAMVRGIEDVARTNGYRLMLCNSDEELGKEAAYIDVAIKERMAGVVIAVASTTRSNLDPLLERGIPVVAVDRLPPRHRVDSVVIDNRLGGAQATDHLLSGAPGRLHHGAEPGQHRHRTPARLSRRVEASRPHRRADADPAGRLPPAWRLRSRVVAPRRIRRTPSS